MSISRHCVHYRTHFGDFYGMLKGLSQDMCGLSFADFQQRELAQQ
jgi:hypothetical protein